MKRIFKGLLKIQSLFGHLDYILLRLHLFRGHLAFFPQLISLLFFEVFRDGGLLVKNVYGLAHGSFVYLRAFLFGSS